MRALLTMVRIHVHTGWVAITLWVLGLGATMAVTVSSITGLYDTPAKVHSYATAVADDALVMLNGRVAGLDSLGGIIANEFGFVASFAMPFMAVHLVTRMTRRNEETGRLEALLAGSISRATPLLAAVLVACVAEVLTIAVFFTSIAAAAGVPAGAAALYALSMGALGLVFLGIAAFVAQLVEHARGVTGIGLGVIVLGYLVRGLGDVAWSPLTWLSPLGWQEETRAFGDARWWPLLLSVVVAAVFTGAALVLAAGRDLGSALLGGRAGASEASAFLRTPYGITVRAHRGSLLGWVAVSLVVAVTYGAVAQPIVDAMSGNPDLATALGAAGGSGADAVSAMTALLLGLLGAAYAVQGVGVLHAEEASGRLEECLAGERSRGRWLVLQLGFVALGVVVITVVGGVGFALSAAWSLGHGVTGGVAAALAAYLPAMAVFGAVAALVFGARPRWSVLVWLAFAAAALIAYLGDVLDLPDVCLSLSPFHLIGNPPVDQVAPAHVVALCALTAGCAAAGIVQFHRRDIPQG